MGLKKSETILSDLVAALLIMFLMFSAFRLIAMWVSISILMWIEIDTIFQWYRVKHPDVDTLKSKPQEEDPIRRAAIDLLRRPTGPK